MKKNTVSSTTLESIQNSLKQKELAKQGVRKLMQTMHKPMIIEDKKKQVSKRACRKWPNK